MKKITTPKLRKISTALAAAIGMAAAPAAHAASQIWTNNPVNNSWSTAANWVGNAVPGNVNPAASGLSGDLATFNSPIALSGIGTAGNPITNDVGRCIRALLFDTANCGAYVFGSSLNDSFLDLAHNTATTGNITVSAAVTNPIVINQGLRIRLPSSTNGRYDITNNAVNPDATLYIAAITNTSASTRPLSMFLGGSNTGTNTIVRIDDNAGANGAILIDKVGAGTWIFAGPNDLPQKTSAGTIARVQIIEGTLIVKDLASLGSISPANINITNTGVLQIDGVTPQNLGMTLRNGGTIRMNGVGGINGLVVGNQAGLAAAVTTVSSGDVFTIGGASVLSGGAADSVLNLNGPGTKVLASANTYIGRYSFNAGTNQIGNVSALNSAANVHVAAGAILDSSLLGAYSLTATALSANGSGTSIGVDASVIDPGVGGNFDFSNKGITLTFTPTAFTGDTTHPVIYVINGSISLNANQFTVINNSGTPLSAGTYRLMQQASGSVGVSGTPFAIVTGAGLAAGHIADIQVSGGFVNLVVSPHATANLSWRGGNPDSNWDNLTTANWFNGVGFAQFGNGDAVTFDAAGLVNPLVNITSTVLPASLRVDAATNEYTFAGSGLIAGPTSLVKVGTNALVVQTVNGYLGGTTVSNGTIRLGVSEAIPSSGSGSVAVYSPGRIDLNNFNNTINGLTGNGVIDNSGGAASILTIGANNSSTTFTGLVQNTSGTTALRKVGTGTFTLPLANTHSGGTTVEAGTLRVDNIGSFGSGPVTVNGGTLNVSTNVNITGLNGAGGTIVNNVNNLATRLTLEGAGNYTGIIGNGTGGGGISLFIKSGTTRLNAANTYSNGTIVASGATLEIGVINPGGSGTAGTSGIIASNSAVISLPTTVSTAAAPANNITNIDANGTITLSSASQGNSFGGLFFGGANNTNIFVGPGSFGGATPFANFLGTAVISSNASWRWFNAAGGGDATTFDIKQGGFMFSRDANTIRLGALIGNGNITAPSQSAPAIFIIGGKNLSTVFGGTISGSNSVTKAGIGSLTLNGLSYYTNSVTMPDPFEATNIVSFTLFSNAVSYLGNTTISNGTLTIVAPNNLTNSPIITLAGGTLDVSAIGYATNQTILDFNSVEQATNSVVVTTAMLDILAGQTLGGSGTITGNVNAQSGSTVNAGLGIGTLAVSGTVSLNGTVNMELSRTNVSQNSDRITAASFSGAGAVLNITNVGPTLVSGTTFQLFSGPVSAFTTVNLPATDVTGQIAYTWQNNLAVNGSITLVSGLSATPAPITSLVTGNSLNLSWPLDHLGWTLQVQTNTLSVGLSNNWVAVAGSTATNQVTVPVVATNQAVFYRLTLPLP